MSIKEIIEPIVGCLYIRSAPVELFTSHVISLVGDNDSYWDIWETFANNRPFILVEIIKSLGVLQKPAYKILLNKECYKITIDCTITSFDAISSWDELFREWVPTIKQNRV